MHVRVPLMEPYCRYAYTLAADCQRWIGSTIRGRCAFTPSLPIVGYVTKAIFQTTVLSEAVNRKASTRTDKRTSAEMTDQNLVPSGRCCHTLTDFHFREFEASEISLESDSDNIAREKFARTYRSGSHRGTTSCNFYQSLSSASSNAHTNLSRHRECVR